IPGSVLFQPCTALNFRGGVAAEIFGRIYSPLSSKTSKGAGGDASPPSPLWLRPWRIVPNKIRLGTLGSVVSSSIIKVLGRKFFFELRIIGGDDALIMRGDITNPVPPNQNIGGDVSPLSPPGS